MRTVITQRNPFGPNRGGSLWEKLKPLDSLRHLDYGAHDGQVLKKLVKGNVVRDGVGLDVNRRVVQQAGDHLSEQAYVLRRFLL